MSLFEGYDWTGVKVVRVTPTNATASDRQLVRNLHMKNYQLSVKFQGLTELVCGDKTLIFDAGSILYLPIDKHRTIPYNKYIRESGTGICIFFTSYHPLPTEATVIKGAGLPLEHFSKVLQKWHQVDRQLACMGEFYRLLDDLKKATYSSDGHEKTKNHLLIAKSYIEQHFTDKYIDIKQLSKFCGLSGEYFRQSFKQIYGVTPLQYSVNLKLKLAQKLLLESELSVGEIALQCGFEDSNYFTRFFGQHMGLPPTHYRNIYRK